MTQGGQNIGSSFNCGGGGFTLAIAPGETVTYNLVWDQKDDQATLVAAGKATITVWLTAGNIDLTQISVAEMEQTLAANPIQVTVTP